MTCGKLWLPAFLWKNLLLPGFFAHISRLIIRSASETEESGSERRIHVKKLIKQARQGDGDAFAELIHLQMENMYKVARAYLKNDEDAADAISETILACYEKLDTLKQDRYFRTWLTRILINKCKDILRRPLEIPFEDDRENGCICDEISNREWLDLLYRMDEKYRTVLLLYYVEGFKIREISQILELKVSTVQTRLARGRQALAKEYCMENGREDA